MRIVFMGTPDFSVPTLEALLKGGHEVIGVVTQPDRPKGRGKAVLMTPVKEKALEYGIPVYQPVKAREESFVELLRSLKPDAMVVIAFGQILPKAILDIPKYGCINIHASLLPKYRGAAPLQWVVLEGEKETGITTMMMDVGMDTGDMLEKLVVPVDKKETYGSIHDKLSVLGGELILSTLEKLENGTLERTPQPEDEATYTKKITKVMGDIDWTEDAAVIERYIRGLNPWPSAYTSWNGKTLKIWDADVLEQEYSGEPGEIIKVEKDGVLVKTGKDTLVLREVQLEGKKRMEIQAFLRGYQLSHGTILKRSES
ncbi:MAG: methionyl-tRNA formyltransferase [Hungatella sp.]